MAPKRKALSQPVPTNQPRKHQSTQPCIDESFKQNAQTTEALNQQADDCVRYMVYRSGNQLPFRKADLQKHIKGVLHRGFDNVLQRASVILENVYGFKLISCEGSSKYYILSNNLPYIEESEEEEVVELPEDRKKILLLLVLTHIFMSTNIVTQASLYSFLKSLHIDPERKHEIFGNVKEYITVTLIKQQYLTIEKDDRSQNLTFLWGARAEKEISQHDVLKFVCKVFKDKLPKDWVTQYKKAEEQPLEIHRNTETVVDEEDEEIEV